MSSNPSFNESPNHFIVLDAIARGMKKIDSIAKVTKLSKDQVDLIVNDLQNQKLVNVVIKKGFFGNKKMEYYITETGSRLLSSKKEELTYKSQKLQQMYESGNRTQMQSYMDDNRMWMPMMLFSGIMSMVMFGSMMSFMGMAMNPAESAQTDGQVDDASGGTTGDTSGGDDSGAGDTADSGSGSDFDTSGFDTSGFDTGGFDSF